MSVLFTFNDLEYELITCVRQANENATNLIPVVQFLINNHIFHNSILTHCLHCLYQLALAFNSLTTQPKGVNIE